MIKILHSLIPPIGGLLLVGCATIFSSAPESIEIKSDPPGARFRYGRFSGVTPATIIVPRKELASDASFSKEGYNEKIVPVMKSVQGITFLGLGWMFVDFLNGNAYKIDPPIINVTLDPSLRLSDDVDSTRQNVEQVMKREATDIDTVRSQDVEQLQAGVVKITAKSSGGTPKGGTGFIVRLDRDVAYIVTAAHVVAGDPQPKVEFFTKRNLPVLTEVLGLEGDDEVRGLALLVVRGKENLPKGLRALPLAETRRFSGGEDIIMIGFPRNAGPWAVVRGNISSRQGRDLYFSPTVDSGHSGGPILQSGKVVGLVAVAGQSSGRGVIARSVHDYVEGFGITVEDHVAPASLESSDNVLVSLKVQELDETLRREFNIPGNTRGVVINYIVPGSPAAAAGLERGDVIVEINHIGVKHLSQYHSVASNITQREMVMLLLNRRGNELFIAVQP